MDFRTELAPTGGERTIRAAHRLIDLLKELAVVNPDGDRSPEILRKCVEITERHKKLVFDSAENVQDWVALTKTIDLFGEGLAATALKELLNGFRDAARY